MATQCRPLPGGADRNPDYIELGYGAILLHADDDDIL